MANGDRSPLQVIGMFVIMVPIVVCSMEMAPGWGIFHLDWPELVFYAIAGVTGAIGLAMIGERYFVPGLLTGWLVSVGALLATALHLKMVNSTHNAVLALVGFLGALPGLGLFWVLRKVQDLLMPPRPYTPPVPLQDAGEVPLIEVPDRDAPMLTTKPYAPTGPSRGR